MADGGGGARRVSDVILIAVAIEGYMIKAVPLILRGVLIAVAISLPFMFSSKLWANLLGLSVLALLFLFQFGVKPEAKKATI